MNKKKLTRQTIHFLLFLSLILALVSSRRKDFHPFKIKYDFSNLKGGLSKDYKNILKEEIELAGEFISNMIYNNNYRNSFSFTEDNLKYCYDKSISFKTK